MAKEAVTFVVTRSKHAPASMSFYTKDGKRVSPDEVKRSSAKQKVSFWTNVK